MRDLIGNSVTSASRFMDEGAVLLVLAGAPHHADIEGLIHRVQAIRGPVAVLIRNDQAGAATAAHDQFYCERLGLLGFIALIRRMSWYRFKMVWDPWPDAYRWMRLWVWPRPRWLLGRLAEADFIHLPVDLSEFSHKH